MESNYVDRMWIKDKEVVPGMLPEQQHRLILDSEILPAWTDGAVRQARPVVLFVAGPPGSAKSAAAEWLHAVLEQRGGAVRVGSDFYKRHHPQYATWLMEDDRTAGVRTRPEVRRWQAEVEAYVRHHGLDAVVETALTDLPGFRAAVRSYREAGYRVEVVAMAAPEAWSHLAVLDRYLDQVHAAGAGRYVSWDNHDGCCSGLLESLAAVEVERLADRLTVMQRDLSVLYSAELTGHAGARCGPRG